MNETKTTPIAIFTHTLERQEPQFRAALPRGIDPLRYIRILRTAVNSNQKLLLAATGSPREQNSFWVAVMKAAASGLVPDGREGVINVYCSNLAKKGEKAIWTLSCEWQPMIYGIYKQLRTNPAIHSAYAHVVRQYDEFDYQLGDEAKIIHRPALNGPGGEIVYAYAIVKLANGELEREVMTRAQIEAVRTHSKAPDSLMWKDFYDQGCCKTVMRRLAKRIPAIDDQIFGQEEEEQGEPPHRTVTVWEGQKAIRKQVDLETDGPPLPDDPVYPEPKQEQGEPLTEEEKAHTRGFADRMAGMERKAVPPEYRGEGNTHLAAKWLEGWLAAPNEDMEK